MEDTDGIHNYSELTCSKEAPCLNSEVLFWQNSRLLLGLLKKSAGTMNMIMNWEGLKRKYLCGVSEETYEL
jgi:hypothetical protein